MLHETPRLGVPWVRMSRVQFLPWLKLYRHSPGPIFVRLFRSASIAATLAWIFGLIGLNSCEFLSPNGTGYLYCHPPPEPKAQYGSCGDCHCINGEKPCPSNSDEIPLTSVGDDIIRQLKQMDVTEGGYEMICNPYNTTGAIQKGTCTSPNQVEYQLELWETAACGKCGGK